MAAAPPAAEPPVAPPAKESAPAVPPKKSGKSPAPRAAKGKKAPVPAPAVQEIDLSADEELSAQAEVPSETPDEGDTDKTETGISDEREGDEGKTSGEEKEAKPAGVRRKLGRPPIKPPPPRLKVLGIVSDPEDPGARLEFAGGAPTIFKQLFTYFAKVGARIILLRFAPDGFTFFTHDNTKELRIRAHYDGRKANWYYCADTFWLNLNLENMAKMFASIDKRYFKITILCHRDAPETLRFILKNAALESEQRYRWPLSVAEPSPEMHDLLDGEALLATKKKGGTFPVQFTLSSNEFKKIAGDIANYSSVFRIEKLGIYPLQFTYTQAGMHYDNTFRNGDKIELKSEVKPGQAFSCTVSTNSCKALANAMVTQTIRIHVRESGDNLFESALDGETLEISTLMKSGTDS